MTAARRSAGATGPSGTAPRWAAPAALGVSLAGLAVAAYLTITHYTAPNTLACPETGVVNCEKVTTSPQSNVLGVPVAVLGVVFFAAMAALNVPRLWRSSSRATRLARLAGAGAGVLFVLYLLYVELFVVNAICLWCTAVHVLAVALFGVVCVATAFTEPPP